MRIFRSLTLILFGLVVIVTSYHNDPYKTLGVSRTSSAKEIKKAYKKLVMEWHPDKNQDPKANEKFVQIKTAYEVLSDAQRKERYDRYGSFDEPQGQQRHHNQHYADFFDFGFGGFGGDNNEPSFFENHRITYRMYMNSILERSHSQPFIIFGYSSYCQFCFRMENIWKEAVTDLEALGYGIGTVNALTDGVLLEKLRVTTLPSIVVLIEGRVVHFRQQFNGISARTIRLFARDVIPSTFLQRITTHVGLRRFLDQWKPTNKISVLMLGVKEEPRLRYYLTAMKYSHFARFAYVFLGSHLEDIQSLKAALNIKCRDCENVIIFKEDPEKGEAARITVSTNQFTQDELYGIIEKNKFLELPRLSSMQYFDELCPTSSRGFRHYCIILPVTDSETDAPMVNTLYRFLQTKTHLRSEKSRVKIAYIYSNRQAFFMEHFSSPKNSDKRKSILVIWRHEYVKAKYAWLEDILSADELEEYKTFEVLKEKLHLIERGNLRLEETAKIVNLNDEHEATFWTKLSRRFVRMVETAWFYITKEEALPVLSVVGSFFVIMLCGYVLNAAFAPDRKREKQSDSNWHPDDPRIPPQRNESMKSTPSTKQARIWKEMEPMIHELRAETYFGLIRLLKPGCRSLIVLVDKESKDVLLHQFARHIFPLRNNKTFSFGYLMIDKNLAWFRTLLEQILPGEDEEGSVNSASTIPALKKLRGINPKHTLGTVLILCGYKLYFSMYHPMYKPVKSHDSEDESLSSDSDNGNKSTKKKLQSNDLNVENVLNGFPNFLDRLCEGSNPRFYIPDWPDNLK